MCHQESLKGCKVLAQADKVLRQCDFHWTLLSLSPDHLRDLICLDVQLDETSVLKLDQTRRWVVSKFPKLGSALHVIFMSTLPADG